MFTSLSTQSPTRTPWVTSKIFFRRALALPLSMANCLWSNRDMQRIVSHRNGCDLRAREPFERCCASCSEGSYNTKWMAKAKRKTQTKLTFETRVLMKINPHQRYSSNLWRFTRSPARTAPDWAGASQAHNGRWGERTSHLIKSIIKWTWMTTTRWLIGEVRLPHVWAFLAWNGWHGADSDITFRFYGLSSKSSAVNSSFTQLILSPTLTSRGGRCHSQ